METCLTSQLNAEVPVPNNSDDCCATFFLKEEEVVHVECSSLGECSTAACEADPVRRTTT